MKPGRDDLVRGVDRPDARELRVRREDREPPVLHRDGARAGRGAGAVDESPVGDQESGGHGRSVCRRAVVLPADDKRPLGGAVLRRLLQLADQSDGCGPHPSVAWSSAGTTPPGRNGENERRGRS